MSETEKICTRTYQPGDIIIHEGELGKHVFLIISGLAEVYKTTEHTRQLINTIGSGEIFGEMGPLTNEPRYASVVAAEETRLIIVNDTTFRNALLNDKLPIIKPLMKQLASRLKDAEILNQEYLERISSLELEVVQLKEKLSRSEQAGGIR
jgi:CRP-like cAMP-binding protein